MKAMITNNDDESEEEMIGKAEDETKIEQMRKLRIKKRW